MVSLCNSARAAVAQATRQTEDKSFFIGPDLVTNVRAVNKRPVALGRSDAIDQERTRLANCVRHEKQLRFSMNHPLSLPSPRRAGRGQGEGCQSGSWLRFPRGF